MKTVGKRKLQIITDVLMSAILLVQMSYGIAGKLLHEILGITFFVLFTAHHILSLSYTKALFSGRHTSDKILKTAVDILMFVSVLLIILSALPVSEYVFTFLGLGRFSSTARTVHMLSAYWGFAIMNLHIGFHLDVMLKKPLADKKKKPVVISALLAVFTVGVFLFIKEGIYKYMLLINRFVFFDFAGGLPLFLVKYIFIGLAFSVLGYGLISVSKRKKNL